jgi:ketosteroid isomerase-like protein
LVNPTSNDSSLPEDAARTVRGELQREYDRAGKAYEAKDAAALMQMVTPDYTQEMPDGQTIAYDEIEPALTQWLATVDSITDYNVAIEELTVNGDQAVAKVREHVSTTFRDPQNRQRHGAQANISRVTWLKTAQGWRIRRAQYLTGQTLVDGVPI